MSNPSSVPVEVSRNLSWSLWRSITQRYVGLVFMLGLFLLFAAILNNNSPAPNAATVASRILNRPGSIFYFYPNASTETHTESPNPNPEKNNDSDGNSSTVNKQDNNTEVTQDVTFNSRKTKTHQANPPQASVNPMEYSDANAPSPTPQLESPKTNTDVAENSSSCDFNDGNWVVDDSPPVYKPGSCPFVEEAFNCFDNGRLDDDFLRYRWQPRGCQIPRLDGKYMLGMLKRKRLVFVGDSLNRNMWESLVCILRESLPDKNKVFEVSGRDDFKTQGFYSFRFEEYDCSIEFIRSPFLVEEWEFTNKTTGARKETLRLDLIEGSATKYQHADVLIFNTAHWWTHPKTTEGKDYYQEGNKVYSKLEMTEAYTKALRTWAKWIDANVNASKTTIFFRGYSSSHFEGGQWNTGGGCDGERTPITNDSYLAPYPEMMNVLESVIGEMKTPVFYLNITRMTDYRKDAHPSIFRQAKTQRQPGMIQDCSHWCLPGVPDVWNQIIYALLLTTHHNPQYNSS